MASLGDSSTLHVGDTVMAFGNPFSLNFTVTRGTVSALDTLFAAGSFELSDELYTNAPSARYTNGIVRAVVEAVAAANPDGVRILEVGAGTGGTTAAVLPALPADRSSYCFTDLSPLFRRSPFL